LRTIPKRASPLLTVSAGKVVEGRTRDGRMRAWWKDFLCGRGEGVLVRLLPSPVVPVVKRWGIARCGCNEGINGVLLCASVVMGDGLALKGTVNARVVVVVVVAMRNMRRSFLSDGKDLVAS